MHGMDPSSAQHQEMGTNNSLENMLVCSKAQQQDRKPRPQPEQALKCPRCDSINTKFCYYNNYSLTQPRYFCKSCRRYWTKGGTLRNVPVGGGCRKNNKRSSSSSNSSSSSASSKRTHDHHHHQPLMITTNSSSNPLISNLQQHLSSYDCNDLSLAFARLQKQSSGQLGFDDHDQLSILGNPNNNHHHHYDILGNPIPTSSATTHSFLDTLRANFHESSTQNGGNHFQNMYYGGGGGYGNTNNGNNNNMGEVVDTGGHEMMLPYDQDHHVISGANTPAAVVVTTMKQEMLSNNGGGRSEGDHLQNNSSNNRVLWGFPWQQQQHGGSDHHGNNNNMGDHLDLGRESWNGSLATTPSWHGLLNSPLM